MGHSSRSVSLSRRAALQPPVRDRLCTSRVPTCRHANRETGLETYREDTGSTSHLQNHLSFPSGGSVPGSMRAAQLRPPDERPPRTLPPWWRDWWRDGVHAVVNTYSSTHCLANTCLGQTRGGQEQSRSQHKVARPCLQHCTCCTPMRQFVTSDEGGGTRLLFCSHHASFCLYLRELITT